MRRHGDSLILHVRPADTGDGPREEFAQLLAVVRCPPGGRAQLGQQVPIHRLPPPRVSSEAAAQLLGQAPHQPQPLRPVHTGLDSLSGRGSVRARQQQEQQEEGQEEQQQERQQLQQQQEAGRRQPCSSADGSARPVAACVVCLDAPPQMGLKHAGTVHKCVCYDCAVELVHKGDGLCPLCRQRIEEVLLVY
jgi:hypothetical protein